MHELQQPDYTGSLPADPRDLQGRSYGAHESSSGYTHPRDARGGYEDFLQKPDYSSDLQGGAWPVEEPKSGGYQHPAIERQYGEPESGGSQFHDLQGQVFAQNSQPQPDAYSDPYLDDQNATQIMKPDFNPHAPYVPTPAPSMYAPVENNPAPNVPEPAPPVMPLPPPLPSYLRSNTKRPVPDVIYDDAPAAPEPAVKPQYLSVNARIITEGAPEAGKTYRLTLEGLTDRWVTLAVYEISAEVILHHIFDSSGQKKTRRIALPVRQAIQLAENDLRGNWHQYQVMYMQGI